jgi:hypothetical protein
MNKMNMTFLKKMSPMLRGMTLVFLSAAIMAQSPVFAQSNANEEQGEEQTQENLGEKRLHFRSLEGSWNLQVTRLNCQTGAIIGTAPAMLTFMRGGTLMDTGTQISPALRGVGHGVWHHDSGGHYNVAFQFFRFNADSTLAGKQVIRQQIVLNHAGTEFTNTSSANVLDVSGNVIATNCSTAIGMRFE